MRSLTAALIACLLFPALGHSQEVENSVQPAEEFPMNDESLAIIQQFDHDYDRWMESKVSRPPQTDHADEVNVVIHKKSQSMSVTVNGKPEFTTMVTTGMAGKETPSVSTHAKDVERVHMSREYNAPLPWAIRITCGYFIHGATEGAMVYMKRKVPHSHGCVRVPPQYARRLFDIVSTAGVKNTFIVVTQ